MAQTEQDRLKAPPPAAAARDYFEAGCACIAGGELAPCPSSMTDAEAVTFYEQRCKCSRNYIN